MEKLEGKKIAILATDGFEQSELMRPLKALKNSGAYVDIVSLKSGEIKGWDKDHWGDSVDVDKTVKEVSASDYDGLLLPGGVINPDKLRTNKEAVQFVKSFFKEGEQKPTAAICHGPWMLIEAGVVEGRRLTSYKSIKTDLKNAGADWVDEDVVVDNGLVTSRNPDDLDAFIPKMIEEYGEGRHRQAS